MRTILALDELLAHAVAANLPGEVEICGRMRMRDEGDDVVRRLVLERPCVLAIGARRWSPLGLLEQWRLPREVPVVLLVPSVSQATMRRAVRLDAFSVVPAGRSVSGMISCVVDECLIASASALGHLPRPGSPVLIEHEPRRPAGSLVAKVLPLATG